MSEAIGLTGEGKRQILDLHRVLFPRERISVISQTIGAMVLDAQGVIVHVTGIARDPAMQESMRRLLEGVKAGGSATDIASGPGGERHRVQILQCVDSDIVLVFGGSS